jgi:ubiquinone/menaquinone biosynthesis C-methylase UbiE
VAARYQRGRALPEAVLDRWGNAVRPYLRPGPLRVADVGAGTGIFAKAWPAWSTATVVAVEPSAAMARAGEVVDPAVSFVQGVAEALPLRAGSVDVVWVSTALHHFGDLDRSAGEFARVLAGDGRVLVRTYVPGRTEVSWADEFPGRSKWVARFQTFEQLVALFADHGFILSDAADVLEWSETYAESARWVEQMRSADSMLTALSDEEISAGLEALRSNPAKIGRLELTLLVFDRQGCEPDPRR